MANNNGSTHASYDCYLLMFNSILYVTVEGDGREITWRSSQEH